MYNNAFVYFEHNKHHCNQNAAAIFQPIFYDASLVLIVRFTVHVLIGTENPIVSFSLHLVQL